MVLQKYPDITSLFLDNEKEQLILILDEMLADPDYPVPVDEMLFMLKESVDNDLNNLLLNGLYEKAPQIEDTLLDKLEQDIPRSTRFYIIYILARRPSRRNISVLLAHCLNYPGLREEILSSAFEDKGVLLLTLADYVQDRSLSPEEEANVIALLETVPRRVYLQYATQVQILKIADLYYSIDPRRRLK